MSSSQCFESPPKPFPDYGARGTLQEIGGLKTYVVGLSVSEFAILLVSNVFGYEAPNLRDIADRVAVAGYLVVVPDFFYGEPFDLNNPQIDQEAWRTVHNTNKGYEDAKLVIADLKRRGMTSIGAAGFCWGGNVVVKLASSNDIIAAVALHPGTLTIDEINKVKVPIAFLGAEIDHASPPEQLKQFGEILSAKSDIDSFVKIFPGVSHGWAIRYNVNDVSATKSAFEAHYDMLDWFIKHIV